MFKKITFEDQGQDFLTWTIDTSGRVIECSPFQSFLWCQYHVLNFKELQVGCFVFIKKGEEETIEIKYAIETIEELPILALSWKQPYAELMLHGKIETRSWSTDYRGLVLICASKKGYNYKEVFSISGEKQYERIIPYNFDLLSGVAIAIGKLSDCRPMAPADEKKCFVEYREGLWCHVYNNVRRIKPFAFKGAQKWSKLTPEVINQIELQ